VRPRRTRRHAWGGRTVCCLAGDEFTHGSHRDRRDLSIHRVLVEFRQTTYRVAPFAKRCIRCCCYCSCCFWSSA
jgi:hypothetical protein